MSWTDVDLVPLVPISKCCLIFSSMLVHFALLTAFMHGRGIASFSGREADRRSGRRLEGNADCAGELQKTIDVCLAASVHVVQGLGCVWREIKQTSVRH